MEDAVTMTVKVEECAQEAGDGEGLQLAACSFQYPDLDQETKDSSSETSISDYRWTQYYLIIIMILRTTFNMSV